MYSFYKAKNALAYFLDYKKGFINLKRLEGPARKKHSSLLRTFVNESFITLGLGACPIKLFTTVIVALL
jgi:hypothetical protein